MEVMPFISVAVSLGLIVVLSCAWRFVNWVWLRPKRLERCLRVQGLKGNPYRFWYGDTKEMTMVARKAQSKPIGLDDDIAPHVVPYNHHTIQKYGDKSFMWMGPQPRVNIVDPNMIRDIFFKPNTFQKSLSNPLFKLFVTGLVAYEGEQWAKHRKILNPVFSLEKLKSVLPAMYSGCSEIMSKWETLVSPKGSCEVDVWPSLQELTIDIISRTAFGSSYEEGRKVFELQEEMGKLAIPLFQSTYIPGWRYLPTRRIKRMKKIKKEVAGVIGGIINRREKAIKEGGESNNDDLLGILLESNRREMQEHGNDKKVGISIEEVIEECRLFYTAGQETTANLLAWTMVMLGKHLGWQTRAREEVFQVFGNRTPDFVGLNHLKVVTMTLYEVMRLFPALSTMGRVSGEKTRLGDIILPAGVEVVVPVILVQHDKKIWGNDAKEFNPERFSEGVAKATKNQASYLPFSVGPRVCVGQNFAMMEAKLAIAMILQRFSLEISPSYEHAPFPALTLQPRYGAKMILRKL